MYVASKVANLVLSLIADTASRAAALSAAKAAAANATPAQRERAVAEAAAQVHPAPLQFDLNFVHRLILPAYRPCNVRSFTHCCGALQAYTAHLNQKPAEAPAAASAGQCEAQTRPGPSGASPARDMASYMEPEWAGNPKGCEVLLANLRHWSAPRPLCASLLQKPCVCRSYG